MYPLQSNMNEMRHIYGRKCLNCLIKIHTTLGAYRALEPVCFVMGINVKWPCDSLQCWHWSWILNYCALYSEEKSVHCWLILNEYINRPWSCCLSVRRSQDCLLVWGLFGWSLHVPSVYLWVFSGFFPQSRNMHVRLTGNCKLPIGVRARIFCLYVSLRWTCDVWEAGREDGWTNGISKHKIKTKYTQMRNKIRQQVNEVDNVSRHLMNGTAVFDHRHRCYLVIIYSSNRSADTEKQGGGEAEQMKTYRETESVLISANKGTGRLWGRSQRREAERSGGGGVRQKEKESGRSCWSGSYN